MLERRRRLAASSNHRQRTTRPPLASSRSMPTSRMRWTAPATGVDAIGSATSSRAWASAIATWIDPPGNSPAAGRCAVLALAKVLLENPDVMLLDEPTNYLDIEARTWLEEFLSKYAGGVLVVSHDRYFLDSTAREVYELWNGKLTRYPGSYSAYEARRRRSSKPRSRHGNASRRRSRDWRISSGVRYQGARRRISSRAGSSGLRWFQSP